MNSVLAFIILTCGLASVLQAHSIGYRKAIEESSEEKSHHGEFYDKREANPRYVVYPAGTSPLILAPPPPVQFSAYSPFSPFVLSTGYHKPAYYVPVAPTISTIQNRFQTQAVQPDAAPAPDREVTARVIPADVEDAPKIVDVIGLREDQPPPLDYEI